MPAQESREHAAQQTALSEKKVVTLYVRKGSEGERLISINPIPPEADPLELLDLGFAIDGNSATIPVAASVDYITWADPEDGI